jgi:hypothetical protein
VAVLLDVLQKATASVTDPKKEKWAFSLISLENKPILGVGNRDKRGSAGAEGAEGAEGTIAPNHLGTRPFRRPWSPLRHYFLDIVQATVVLMVPKDRVRRS